MIPAPVSTCSPRGCQARPSARPSRRGKASEKGQVLVLFVLITVTLFLFCVLATAVGQSLVRRHQAQLVVDAAAWAGASKQSEGMNLIARYNEKNAGLIRGIQTSMQVPYMDDSGTTWERLFTVGALYNDWAGDTLEDYQKIFDGINNYINAINLAYASPPGLGITQTGRAAKRVVDANFAGGDSIFKPQDLRGHGIVFEPGLNPAQLVKLTEKRKYELDGLLGGYRYVPYFNHYAVTCNPGPWCINVPCCAAKAALVAGYAAAAARFSVRGYTNPIKYQFGRYYDNKSTQDVRFTYYVEVDSSPVIFGRNFFDDIPPILVVASGKPYGGYLGTRLEQNFLGFWRQRDGREASYTYKAKLVPVRPATLAALAAQRGDFSSRFLTVVH